MRPFQAIEKVLKSKALYGSQHDLERECLRRCGPWHFSGGGWGIVEAVPQGSLPSANHAVVVTNGTVP